MNAKDMNGKDTMDLPNEVLLNIMKCLPAASDLLSVGRVCRQWRFVSEQNILWKPLCKHVAALAQDQQQTCNQPEGYKALYVSWRQKWRCVGETQCEDMQLEYKLPQGRDSVKFRGRCLAVTDKYILGCTEQNRDKLIVWSSSGVGKELVDLSVPQRSGVFVTHFLVSSDEKCMVLVTNQSNIAQVFDIGSARKVHELRHPEQIDKIWMHKKYLIVNIRNQIYAQCVWNIDTGVQLYQWDGFSSLPDAVVVCDGNLALVCHMHLESSGRLLNPRSPLINVYDLTTGENILHQYWVPSLASTTIALSESRSMFAYIYDHGTVGVHHFGQDISKRDFRVSASHICFHDDYLFIACKRELLIFEVSKIRSHVVSAQRFHNIGYACVGVIHGPSVMPGCQKIHPVWCGLVVTVNDNAVNLLDIVNMRVVKTLVKTQCEDMQLEYEVPQGRGNAKFRGRCLAVTDKYILGCSEQNKDKLIVWSPSGTGKELVDLSVPQSFGVFVTHCLVSSDEKCVVLVTNQSNIAQVFDIASGRKVHELSHPEQIDKIWIHKNNLIVNIRKWIYEYTFDVWMYVWDIDTGVLLYQWHDLTSLPNAVVVCDGSLALVCHMPLDPLRRRPSPLLKVYDLTTGENIVHQYLDPSPASTTIALSESRSMFACIYDVNDVYRQLCGFVGVHHFGQDIIKHDFVDRASHICFHDDYLLVACKRELLIFEVSKIRPHVVSAQRFHDIGSACVGVIHGPSVMHGCQKIYPLWCGLVVTVNDNAVNLLDIVNMRVVKTLVKLHEGQKFENIYISDHKVKCIVSDRSQPNIKCIQLNVGP